MMKRYKQLVTAFMSFTIVGILVGCGTDGTGSVTKKNQVSNGTDKTTSTGGGVQDKANTYTSYYNNRFGFTVQYPSTWTKGQTPADQDGLSFSTPSNAASYDNGLDDGNPNTNVVLAAVETNNVVYSGDTFDQMVQQIENQYIPSLQKTTGISEVRYGVVQNKWVWIEFTQKVGKNAIQVQKSYITLNSDQTMTFTYPANEAGEYTPIWNHISNSFVVGDKNG